MVLTGEVPETSATSTNVLPGVLSPARAAYSHSAPSEAITVTVPPWRSLPRKLLARPSSSRPRPEIRALE